MPPPPAIFDHARVRLDERNNGAYSVRFYVRKQIAARAVGARYHDYRHKIHAAQSTYQQIRRRGNIRIGERRRDYSHKIGFSVAQADGGVVGNVIQFRRNTPYSFRRFLAYIRAPAERPRNGVRRTICRRGDVFEFYSPCHSFSDLLCRRRFARILPADLIRNKFTLTVMFLLYTLLYGLSSINRNIYNHIIIATFGEFRAFSRAGLRAFIDFGRSIGYNVCKVRHSRRV